MTSTLELDSPADIAASDVSEQRISLYNVDWEAYEGFSRLLQGRHVRLTFDRGVLEFMTISHKHGWIARLLNRLVVILAEETGTPLRSCGDVTMRRRELDRAIEPDECFYLTNEPAVRGLDEIDLGDSPPPDLGVEVDLSSTSRRRMPIYAAMKVPEIWLFGNERVLIHRLADDGAYRIAGESVYFPFVTSAALTDFIARRSELDENSLMASFRAWVRQQLAGGAAAPDRLQSA